MIKLDADRASILADGYNSYGKLGEDLPLVFVSSDLIKYDDDWILWLCVFGFNDASYDDKLYGFTYITSREESFRDLNSDPIECFEVEFDPTPRYRRKET